MKNQIKNLILFLIFAFSSNVSFCYTLTSEQIKNEILSKVTPEIKSQLKNYSSDFEINIQGVPNQEIITNENIKPRIEIISQNSAFSSNSYKRILIKNSKNDIIKSFATNVQTKVYAPVLVASKTIQYNQEINELNTKLERKEISRYLGKTYFSQVSNLTSNRNYPTGSIILSSQTKAQFAILKNSNVDIVFKSKNMNIKLKGRALKDGAIGETILVRSDKFNKTYTGIVKSQNEVIVRI